MGRWRALATRAAFFEPLEATAIGFAQLQVGMVLHMRLNRPVEHRDRDAPVVNRFLTNYMLCLRPVRGLALLLRFPVRQRILAVRS